MLPPNSPPYPAPADRAVVNDVLSLINAFNRLNSKDSDTLAAFKTVLLRVQANGYFSQPIPLRVQDSDTIDDTVNLFLKWVEEASLTIERLERVSSR